MGTIGNELLRWTSLSGGFKGKDKGYGGEPREMAISGGLVKDIPLFSSNVLGIIGHLPQEFKRFVGAEGGVYHLRKGFFQFSSLSSLGSRINRVH